MAIRRAGFIARPAYAADAAATGRTTVTITVLRDRKCVAKNVRRHDATQNRFRDGRKRHEVRRRH